MADESIHLDGMTIAVTDLEAMADFYRRVFGADLRPVPFGPATLYVGPLAGWELQLCPREVAGITADDNRHQLRFAVPDLSGVLTAAAAAGGTVLEPVHEAGGRARAAVRDPDGNSIELVAAAVDK